MAFSTIRPGPNSVTAFDAAMATQSVRYYSPISADTYLISTDQLGIAHDAELRHLLAGSRNSPVADIVLLEKPAPMTERPAPIPQFDEYMQVANELGFATPAMLKQQVLEFLLDKGYPIYNTVDVGKYMDRLMQKENADKKAQLNQWGRAYTYGWYWRPLRAKDGPRFATSGAQHLISQEMASTPYDKPVPIDMLKRANDLHKKFGDQVKVFVSDYAKHCPDPFIGCTFGGTQDVIVFGVWAEPGFGPSEK